MHTTIGTVNINTRHYFVLTKTLNIYTTLNKSVYSLSSSLVCPVRHFLSTSSKSPLKSGQLRSELSLNPLNAESHPICHLLALLAHHILHVSRIRVKISNSVPSSALIMQHFLTSDNHTFSNAYDTTPNLLPKC